ncbi:hypothetical protein MMC07_006262 [Pseudocyphellaria aurata]|nr:hypothetical protein [Pseudocyphellaria aurata]
MPRPTISSRKHFRWIPDEPGEPTSTIVLTSHTSHYVDVRIYKDQYRTAQDGNKDGNALEWAFAGKSQTTQASMNDGVSKPQHSVWEHWIDSKSDNPSADEGDMWPQANGDVLERGTQKHPVTGLECEYEERWADLDVEVVGNEKTRISVVLKIENSDKRTRGLVVRVGSWCQGILQVGDKITIERWQWTNSGWIRIVRIGDGILPCDATFIDRTFMEEINRQRGDLWKVVESFCW